MCRGKENAQNFATETKARSFKPGKRYALCVDNGNQGRSSSAICVAWMMLLSGKLTEYSVTHGILLEQGMFIGVQW